MLRDITDKSGVSAVIFGSVIGYSGMMLLPISVGIIIQEYGISDSEMGFISAVQLLCAALASLFVSNSISKINLGVVSILGTLLIAVANGVSAVIHHEIALISSRILTGSGEGITLSVHIPAKSATQTT